MDKLKTPTPSDIAGRELEERIYEMVGQEIDSGVRRQGLWLKAIAESNGDEFKAKALYVKYRAQVMLDEAHAAAEKERIELRSTTAMFEAALYGRVDQVRQYLAEGVDINARNPHGATALFLASLHGHTALVRLLVDAGADRTIPNHSGKRPADVALEAGRREEVGLLSRE